MFRIKKKLWTSILLVFVSIFVWSVLSFAQEEDSKKKESKIYTVKGYRHGVSYFKKTFYKEAKPLKEGVMDFKHYHTYTEVNYFLKKWAEDYPDLIDLYVGGQSFEGRDIYQVTLTNKKTGKDTEKPAMALDGNRHSGEVTAAESALWLLHYLLTHYDTDEEIRHLVDTKAFYFRIKNNPDGSMLYLNTAQSNRSTVRPHDSDGDGLLDEDPGEDLDGDGFIRRMRVKVDPDSGDYYIDPKDPTGRIMQRVKQGETGDYKIYSEGIDNDGDGRYNEDGIGGLDLHRNYPENWRPEPGLDKTGRGWTQWGAGQFPLSESETRSFVLFLLTHPNVSIVNTMDTTVPMHLRPPSTSKSEERMYPSDLAFYEYFDREGKRITGYPWAGDVYYDYRTRRKINPYTGDPVKPGPLFGHSPDFGYWYYGSIWYGDELWCGGSPIDYNNDGEYDEYEEMRWNDEALGGKGFMNWTKFDHPQLGEVEIGGFNPKFYSQNPPTEFLEEWIKKQAMFNLFLAKHLPEIKITDVKVNKRTGENIYDIHVSFTNSGYLPTALEQALLVKIVQEDRVRLEFDKELTRDRDHPKVEIIVPEVTDKDVYLGRTRQGEVKTAYFKVKFNGIYEAKCTVNVLSTRGGHVKKEITIGR